MPRVYRPLPAPAELWDLYDYKPLTGELLRKRAVRGASAGDVTGSMGPDGYLVVGAPKYLVHRLIWKWVTGIDPSLLIDHKDRCRANNAWHNLREASELQNKANAAARCDSGTKIKGVQLQKGRNRYKAKIRINGRQVYLGSYATAEEAGAAYTKAAFETHGDFAYTGCSGPQP
jgi:hypothetical protein